MLLVPLHLQMHPYIPPSYSRLQSILSVAVRHEKRFLVCSHLCLSLVFGLETLLIFHKSK